jgi:hypothetical protein
MKTKLYWLMLLASAAIVSQMQAHGFGGGGGGFGGAHFGGAGFGGGHVGGGPAFHAVPVQGFGGGHVGGAHFSGGPTGYSGPRFSSVGGMRSPSVRQFNPRVVTPNVGSSVAARQSTRESINGGNDVARFANRGNRAVANAQHTRQGVGQVRNGNNTLRPDWRNHVFAQHSANWHHDWDRSRDHWWHGHRCHFFNGTWVIFDVGFDPWWWSWPCPGYDYGYPCDDGYYDY